jgi:hypothetical protein
VEQAGEPGRADWQPHRSGAKTHSRAGDAVTPAELNTKVAGALHRTDLGTTINTFITDANARIQRRFGVTLNIATTIPAGTELLYYYATLQATYEYLNDGDNARYYADRWELECDRQNVLNPGTVTDNYAAEPPNMGV